MLADILDHAQDTPWPGCTVELSGKSITFMPSGIGTILLVGVGLMLLLPWMARKQGAATAPGKPRFFSIPGSFIEVTVLFVRDQIALPSLGKDLGYRFLPFLLTMFVFVLGMNVIGLLPIESVTGYLTNHQFPIGYTPTAILSVCATLAMLALIAIVGNGLWLTAQKSKLPFLVAFLLSPVLWFWSLAPHIPGTIGKIMALPLAALELLGVLAKCFSLMVRLLSNMLAGHIMLAILMMFILSTLTGTYESVMDPSRANEIHFFYVGPICVVSSVLLGLMELMVAGLQAYILTYLTAMLLGLYVSPDH